MSPPKFMPTQKYIDAQLLNLKAIRIRYPIADSQIAAGQCVDVDLNEVRLAQLRNALRLSEDRIPFGCRCSGTASIELIGEHLPHTVLIFHLHQLMHSLWLPESTAGTPLLDGKPILRLLYECGVRSPLEAVIDSFSDLTRCATAAMVANLQQLADQLPPDTEAQLTPDTREPVLTSSKQGKSTK